jgi:hypothetical protein
VERLDRAEMRIEELRLDGSVSGDDSTAAEG